MTQTVLQAPNRSYQSSPKQETKGDISALIILVLSCAALFFFRLGACPFLDPGDGYFTEASREMIESGDYVTPHLNYQIYFSKPILIYWLISAAYHALGVNELAGRIWSAILATSLVLCTYWLARSLAGRRAGLIAGLILACSPLVVTFARMALVDMAFSSFLGIAMCAMVMTLAVSSKRWWPVIYIALALAVLTKGPAAIVLFGLGTLAFLLCNRPGKEQLFNWVRQLHLAWGAFIFSAIAVPWYVAVGLATKGLFLKVFFLFENLGRYAGQTNHRHPEPWYYLPVFAYGFFPWIFFLPPAFKEAFKSERALQITNQPLVIGRQFLACWAAAIFLFFTFSTAKLETYILPVFPAVAVLVAMALDQWMKFRWVQGSARSWFGISSLILTVISSIVGIAGLVACVIARDFPMATRITVGLASIMLAVGWSRQHKYLKLGNRSGCIAWLVSTSVLVCAFLAPVAFEVGYRFKQKDLHDVALAMRNREGQLAIFQEFKPTLMFYLQRPIDSFFNADQLEPVAGTQRTKQYVIAGSKAFSQLVTVHGNKFRPVYKQGAWGLYEAQGLKMRKLPTLEKTFAMNLNLNCGDYSWGTLPFAGGTPNYAIRKNSSTDAPAVVHSTSAKRG